MKIWRDGVAVMTGEHEADIGIFATCVSENDAQAIVDLVNGMEAQALTEIQSAKIQIDTTQALAMEEAARRLELFFHESSESTPTLDLNASVLAADLRALAPLPVTLVAVERAVLEKIRNNVFSLNQCPTQRVTLAVLSKLLERKP